MKYKTNWWNSVLTDSEKKNLINAFDNKKLSMGEISHKFEKDFSNLTSSKYSLTTTSGTMALYLALKSLGIKTDDEVLVPAFTWISTANAPQMIGAKVILVDIDKNKPVININDLKKKISKKTKAIICVHLNGITCDIEALKKIRSTYRIPIIEDCAQSLMSKYKNKLLGTFFDIGCFSFGVTKLLTTGQGGMIVTNKNKIFKKIKLLRNNGLLDILSPKYIYTGLNLKSSDLLFSLAKTQLKNIQKKINHLINLHKNYKEALNQFNSIKLINVDYQNGEVPLYNLVRCKNVKKIIKILDDQNIQSRKIGDSLDKSNYFIKKGSLKNSKIFAKETIYLPSGPNQNIRIAKKIQKIFLSSGII